ncbi:hypothetical protein R3P38DRAFT_3239786 [Favolaschia claudopus]|uniref:Uncharacterized protein n=1 Tax=Favolaschia claudopus TaxID=2862362 RepID=A0AAV9Z841_9AGAR
MSFVPNSRTAAAIGHLFLDFIEAAGVPPAVDDVRQMLTEEVGSRGSHLSWFTLEFAGLAEQVYLHIGKPTLSLETAWGVFQQMAQPIADVIEL